MALTPGVEEQQLLADTLELQSDPMTTRERLAEFVVSTGFVAAAAAIWCLAPPQRFALAPAALCVVLMALATLVRFDTPFGFTVATQLAFVPLLFAVPVAVGPVAVLLALALARLGEIAAGKARPSRLLLVVGNAWFAIGPAAVFAIAATKPADAGPALLLAALLAQFLVDFGSSTIRQWILRDASVTIQLHDLWIYGMDGALSGIGLVVAEDVQSHPIAPLALVPLLAVLAMFANERNNRLRNLLELGNAYRGTALVLGDVVEADDGYTGEHCRSVVGLALAVGAELGLNAEQMRNLEFAALLHDVGKIAVPKEIINKPGKLEPHEWTIIKTHTIEGQKMLDRVGGFMREVGQIVRSHHERWDGSGYPDGLEGEAIPLEARIIACCDTWNAMRTDRSYRRALPHAAALAELSRVTGTQLDPDIAARLAEIVEREDAVGSAMSGEAGSRRLSLAATPA